ncbi:MAG TPA: A/G-specific adenine glycosylase [Saprospiraceae bacterium]|nr:A/G-specific adenine glycosylase [Saprospiraceae bacterium]HQW56567.1 A/G-specific adenine glycosylase [Saprospiraceae bacterium]
MSSVPFSKLLLGWYDPTLRPMPWKEERDPYRIWISEVILHQTRVAQGWNYYLRFLEKFPDLQSLAAATPEAVLQIWQGLGYYRRALHLHQAARQIAEEYDGKIPSTSTELIKIKGIGAYTAAALASFAWREPIAAVDGNVYRILSRVFCEEANIDTVQGRKVFTQLAGELLDKKQPHLFNQAMMDLGATICTPRKPACIECPLNQTCCAFGLDAQSKYPIRNKKKEKSNVYLYYLVCRKENLVWLHKRSESGIYRDMYEFYLVAEETQDTNPDMFSRIRQDIKPDLITLPQPQYSQHLLTHRKLHISIYEINAPFSSERLSFGRFYTIAEALKLPTPIFIFQYLTALLSQSKADK